MKELTFAAGMRRARGRQGSLLQAGHRHGSHRDLGTTKRK
jgi:hypothetical protein